jgi:hypothetical protein
MSDLTNIDNKNRKGPALVSIIGKHETFESTHTSWKFLACPYLISRLCIKQKVTLQHKYMNFVAFLK